ncbi:uncharacterized protein LOC110454907 [Mizuhopecten yessoensis]|uniref:Uncharacterized protein n=1 Tax=Mizuhopecten yessoensis TaxID=6573 RepID=A0A210QE12_MIZYE|nr:uncharacterized protein LOC110454907 [Mizuhopecten yessoensis]OWF46994.1 hypothetical protein KP79_PYT10110 [Mizuhopecten yessoensis]
MVLNRIDTRFFKLDEKRALQVEFHRIGSNSKPGPKKWLKDDQLSEIKNLLHDIIKQCVNDTEKTEKKTERSSQIITGNTVKLGCVFKKSPSHDVLLGEASDDESPYRSLYGQKLIVYVCPIETGSPNNGSELYRAMVRAEIGSTGKMMKISTYFSKAGGSGTQGSGTGTAQTTSSSSSSQDQKQVIRNIMKRGKMAKQSKKVESSARKREEQIKPKQQENTSQNTSDHKQQDDTTPDANIAGHKEKMTSTDDNITQSINNPPTSTEFSLTSDVIDITSYKGDDMEFMPDATVSKCRHKNQTGNFDEKQDSMASENIGVTRGVSSLGTITLCGVSSSVAQDFQPSDEHTITVYSAEQIQDLKLEVIPPACHPDPSVKVNRTTPVPSTFNPSPSEEGLELGDDSNDSILPSYSFIDQKTESRPDDNSDLENKNSDVDSDTLFDQFSDTHVDDDSIRAVTSDSDSSSDDNFPVLSTTQRRKSPFKVLEGRTNGSTLDDSVTDSDGGACLKALKRRMTKKRILPNFPSETKSDEEIPNKRLKYDSEIKSSKTNNETFDSDVQTPDTLKSTSVVELPSLMRSRNSKMSRAPKELKQATLSFKGGNLAVTKTQDTQPCVSENDRLDCIIMEDQASQRLRSDLRREVIHAESVKDLNEQHVRFLVQENRRYLKDIFEGKIPCERHKLYKQGGRTRNRLNYQVYLGLFTDEQQDVVMEALMSIFCKKNHGFLDYVMKVILPEVLIKIYMEVTGLNHEEVDHIMASGGS